MCGKCKNVECSNDVKPGRTYCSLTCRNVYVNKYMRDYSKNGKGLRDNSSARAEYQKNPPYCKFCGKQIPYEKRGNKYCNSSCQAKVTNKKRVVSEKTRLKQSQAALNRCNGTYKTDPCPGCGKEVKRINKRKYCSDICRKESKRKHLSEYEKYKRDCAFSFVMKDFPDEFDFSLIEHYGWYKPKNRGNNLNGVSRDHMFSIREGFRQKISPTIISHPANCKLMRHEKNISKNDKCSISIEILKERIKEWDKKYGPDADGRQTV